MTIPNRMTLDAMKRLTVGEIAGLPAAELGRLHQEAEQALRDAKLAVTWMESALAQKYGEQLAACRHETGKDTGVFRFTDGEVVIAVDVPKRVDWDQEQLQQIARSLAEAGEDPAEFIDASMKVTERKYNALPSAWAAVLSPARTVWAGKPSFKLQLNGEGA